MRDLAKLDEFLSSSDKPKDCMTLFELDGFLHGIANGRCEPFGLVSALRRMSVSGFAYGHLAISVAKT